MFDVGEEVVCIDDSPTSIYGHTELVKGQHYIVEWVGITDKLFDTNNKPRGPVLAVHVKGVRRKNIMDVPAVARFIERFGFPITREDLDVSDIPFGATRFAPLKKQKKETDISQFTTFLKTKERVLEDV